MERLDLTTWKRAELFREYTQGDLPYVILGGQVDVTGLLEHVRRNHLSFYFALVWLCNQIADGIINFRYRFDDEGPFILPHNNPVMTHMRPGEDIFVMLEGPAAGSLEDFCAKTKALADDPGYDYGHINLKGRHDYINYSCIPWVDYTHFIRSISRAGKDNNPKISWGRYVAEADGRVRLTLSVQVHHGLADGYHVGLFFQQLQQALDRVS